MNIFLCDIRGTINGNEDNREEQLLRLANNLNVMCDILQLDELYFDFISTERMDTVLKYVRELEPYLRDSKIKFGVQFSEKEEYKNGKIIDSSNNKTSQMSSLIEENHVERIILADDTWFNHKVLSHTLRLKNPNIEMISLIPNVTEPINNSFSSTKYGIEGLNETIESYINAFEILHNQMKKNL